MFLFIIYLSKNAVLHFKKISPHYSISLISIDITLYIIVSVDRDYVVAVVRLCIYFSM